MATNQSNEIKGAGARVWIMMSLLMAGAFFGALLGASGGEGPIQDWIKHWAPVLGAVQAMFAAAYGFLDRTVAMKYPIQEVKKDE